MYEYINDRLFVTAVGVKGSAVVNSILTVVNLCVMALVVIVGFYYADIDNWTIEGKEQPVSKS